MIKAILLVGTGSFIGGALRYLISQCIPFHSSGFPLGTFIINIAGSLLIGLIWGIFNRYTNLSSDLCLLLTTGLCGGFTTFSTFSNESLKLLQSNNYTAFFLYVIGSVVLGILASFLGMSILKSY